MFCVHLQYCRMCLRMKWFSWHTVSYITSKSYNQCNNMTLVSIIFPLRLGCYIYERWNTMLVFFFWRRRTGFHFTWQGCCLRDLFKQIRPMAALKKNAFPTKHTTCFNGADECFTQQLGEAQVDPFFFFVFSFCFSLFLWFKMAILSTNETLTNEDWVGRLSRRVQEGCYCYCLSSKR